MSRDRPTTATRRCSCEGLQAKVGPAVAANGRDSDTEQQVDRQTGAEFARDLVWVLVRAACAGGSASLLVLRHLMPGIVHSYYHNLHRYEVAFFKGELFGHS